MSDGVIGNDMGGMPERGCCVSAVQALKGRNGLLPLKKEETEL